MGTPRQVGRTDLGDLGLPRGTLTAPVRKDLFTSTKQSPAIAPEQWRVGGICEKRGSPEAKCVHRRGSSRQQGRGGLPPLVQPLARHGRARKVGPHSAVPAVTSAPS